MTKIYAITIFLLATLLCSATTASAQSDRERARTLFNEAASCYDLGRYDCALEKWAEVYELTEVPSILYNLGNTQERLGNLEQAVVLLQQYRPHVDGAQLDVLDSRILNLQERVALQNQAAAAEEAEQARIAAQIREREVDSARLQEEREELERERARLEEELVRAEQAAEARRAPAGLRAARWTTLAIGVGGVATGLVFQVKRASLKSDLEAECGGANGVFCPLSAQEDVDSYSSSKTGVIVGYSVGAVALTTSLVTFLLKGNRDRPEDSSGPDLSFSPTWYANGGGGFQLRTNF